MPKIMIKCLKTGQVVSTGMATDNLTWRKLADNWEGDRFLCPACAVMHEWVKSDATLEVTRLD